MDFLATLASNPLFYPTLGYNLARNRVQPGRWRWYSRVNDSLIVGAMPFKSMLKELKDPERLGGVVCCTEAYELKAAWAAVRPADWAREGIAFHHTPMADFVGSTSQQNIEQAVQFIDNVVAGGKTCYVHCKAGRTRSATVAACYLMHAHDLTPEQALQLLLMKRPQVWLGRAHLDTVRQYRTALDEKRRGEEKKEEDVG